MLKRAKCPSFLGTEGAKDIFSAEEESNLPQFALLYICQLLLSYRREICKKTQIHVHVIDCAHQTWPIVHVSRPGRASAETPIDLGVLWAHRADHRPRKAMR